MTSKQRIRNRRDSMRLAQQQAINGDPVCGAFFAAMDAIKHDPDAAFLIDHYDVDFDDDSDEARPY